jgi:hypothetical protein
VPLLTSLRDNPQVFVDIPVEKKKDLLELQSIVSDLEKKRTLLLGEIERLTIDTTDIKKRLGTEIGTLKLQRKKLLLQISTLTSILLKTQNQKDKVVKGMEQFGNEHIQFLNSLSNSLQLDVKGITAKIAKRSAKIKEQEDFIDGFYSYLTDFALNNEAKASYNDLESLRIKKMDKDVSLNKKQIDKMYKETKDFLRDTENANKIINDKRKSIEKLNKWFENNAIKEHDRLEQWEKELKLQKKEIIAERKGFIAQRLALTKREKKIKDKEETLIRSYAEVKAKAAKAGIVL